MEVAIPVPATDFHFDSTCSSPYISAPSSPKAFSSVYSYYSAPTSPTRSSTIYSAFDDWEEKAPTPESIQNTHMEAEDDDEDYDFAFDFSGQLEKAPLTAAEELFDQGKIRPLRPPPKLQNEEAPKKPVLSSVKSFCDALSPKQRKNTNPFATAAGKPQKGLERERGRERVAAPNLSSSSRRAARSHSPFRVSDPKPEPSSLKGGSKKWRLKDFLLFRSASEGRATDKDPLRKYGVLPKKEDVKNSSFRSTDSSGSGAGSRRGPVSAHERHYTAKRAVSEEMRRKTFLPYRQGLLGCLGFNPTFHGLAKGFQSVTGV
ncbi:uncharacterized protein LOC131242437 [Magnolia sinica]|uniref:uncharacterized protein LOC131242437 n=1 Tax=Magnolia sinica TaxID=86752 RepID=UPI00265A0DC2|nr:uncharacterized protein LOC131242437 [Magnolia sinica]